MKYKLIIFDFDGTLADTIPWFMGMANDVAERFGLKKLDQAQLEALRGDDSASLLRSLQIPAWKLPLIANHVRKLTALNASSISLFENVGCLLKHLSSKGIGLAIVSSNAEDNIITILGPENAALIRFYECGASIFGKKRKLRNVLKRSGVSAREALCIGDETRDAEAARQAGIDFGAVSWGFANAEALNAYAPRYYFSSVSAIAGQLAGVELPVDAPLPG